MVVWVVPIASPIWVVVVIVHYPRIIPWLVESVWTIPAPTVPTATAAPPVSAHAAAKDFRQISQRALAQRADVSSDAASADACLHAVALASRTLLADRWAATQQADAKRKTGRRVHYLSMEFLMGRALGNALASLGMHGEVQAALPASAPALGEVLEAEPDAALGNGGLGRLAACFLDSFATLGLPSFGYGLRYRHGMFAQHIQEGCQVEQPDEWL